MNTPVCPSLAPVLFVSHGAPTFALEAGLLGPQLHELGERLWGVQALLVVSPHWQTREIRVMRNPQPSTVHDFGGFPSELYQLHYPAKGSAQWAELTLEQLSRSGLSASFDEARGLDHGAWVPLMHLLPQAQLPVFQLSLPYRYTTQDAYALGQALAPLREKGLMIVGSGSMTHNLSELGAPQAQAESYAQEFSHWIKTAVLSRAERAVMAYRDEAPWAHRAHPSEEHFLPLLVAMGASLEQDRVEHLYGGIEYGVLSMDSFVWQHPLAPQ